MKMDLVSLIFGQITALKQRYGYETPVIVDSEQAFVKRKDLEPGTVFVLVRELTDEIQIGVRIRPIQMLILSEQNALEEAKAFFSAYAREFNWESYEGFGEGVFVKQQWTDPAVLSNFNAVDYGYRSVLYCAATFYVMENVCDLRGLKIDNDSVKALTFGMAYGMTPNTQQLKNEYIAKSVKSVSSLSITMSIPMTESPLLSKVNGIMAETLDGNEDFEFSFSLGSTTFTGLKMKLTMTDFSASIADVPAIRLGFTK